MIAAGRSSPRASTSARALDRVRDGALPRVIWRVTFGVALSLSGYWIAGFYLWPSSDYLFLDAHIYFRATGAWLDGANPWQTTYMGVPFAAIPPTLLLNVPLQPFGEPFAILFWVAANTAAIGYLIRQLHLPRWIVLLLPVLEGWLGASPDLALAALLVAGGGWVAALAKPYSIPALLAHRRWRQLFWGMVAGVVTIPFLPWIQFFESREIILDSFARFAGNPVSAVGHPLLIVAVTIALVSLGWRRGWSLTTPGLLAQQPHYLVFSLGTIARSRLLILAMTIPIPHSAAIGVIAYAALVHVQSWRRLKSTRAELETAT